MHGIGVGFLHDTMAKIKDMALRTRNRVEHGLSGGLDFGLVCEKSAWIQIALDSGEVELCCGGKIVGIIDLQRRQGVFAGKILSRKPRLPRKENHGCLG